MPELQHSDAVLLAPSHADGHRLRALRLSGLLQEALHQIGHIFLGEAMLLDIDTKIILHLDKVV